MSKRDIGTEILEGIHEITQFKKGHFELRTSELSEPDNERWLHEPQTTADLQSALTWAASNPASDSNTDAVMTRLSEGQE